MVLFICFFQAEDGIRDAQESRGLGDVYKRQVMVLINRKIYRHLDQVYFNLIFSDKGSIYIEMGSFGRLSKLYQ